MPNRLQKTRDDLKSGSPGSRFQDLYEKRQQSGNPTVRKAIFLGGGTLVLAAGIFFLPAPGPGILIVALGAGLIAQESRAAARLMDWTEVTGRRVLGWARDVWEGLPTAGKIVVSILAVALLAGSALGAYTLFFG